MKLESVKDQVLARMSQCRLMTLPGLAEATTVAGQIKHNLLEAFVDGIGVSVAAATDKAWGAGLSNVGDGKKALFLLTLTAAGAISGARSEAVDNADADPVLPSVPAGETPFGTIKIVNTSGADFVPGTTDLSAAGIAATFADVSWPTTGDDALEYS